MCCAKPLTSLDFSGSAASGEERIDPVRSAASLVRSTARDGAARAAAGVAFHE